MFPQDIEDNLRELARRIDAINTSRPGPTSWGPGDGEASAIADDGRTLFSFGSTGASVESRGVLTGLTPLLDGIRSKNDAQDGRLDGHDGDVSRIDAKNTAQDGTLSAHDGRITTAQGRADDAWSRAGTALSNAAAAQSRADSAYSRAGTGISDAADAKARADSAFDRAADAQATANSANDKADQIIAWINRNLYQPGEGPFPNDFPA